MVETGKSSKDSTVVTVKPEPVKPEQINIALQDLSCIRVKRAAGLQRESIFIVLKLRITDCPPGVHDAWLTLTADIQDFWMIQPQRMAIFMGSRRGVIDEVVQLEIARIASDSVDE